MNNISYVQLAKPELFLWPETMPKNFWVPESYQSILGFKSKYGEGLLLRDFGALRWDLRIRPLTSKEAFKEILSVFEESFSNIEDLQLMAYKCLRSEFIKESENDYEYNEKYLHIEYVKKYVRELEDYYNGIKPQGSPFIIGPPGYWPEQQKIEY